MPSATITDLIRMYSTGVISRESLEREICRWRPARAPAQDGPSSSDEAVHIVLHPDADGVWRA